MGPEIERANPQLAKEFELVQDQLRELTTQIAMKDRIHNIRVGSVCQQHSAYASFRHISCPGYEISHHYIGQLCAKDHPVQSMKE